eukprot:Clim_evm26s204 gene=Clim_evmTU26s204
MLAAHSLNRGLQRLAGKQRITAPVVLGLKQSVLNQRRGLHGLRYGHTPREMSAKEAVEVIKSGNRVFLHSVSVCPPVLVQALVDRAHELRGVEIVSIHTEGPAPYVEPQYKDNFRGVFFFVGKNTRKAVQEGRAEFVPIFLSEVESLWRSGLKPLDVALMMVSPPDDKGYCSLGPSVDVSLSALMYAKHVVAQVNKHVPRTHGASLIHISQLDAIVPHDEVLPEMVAAPISPVMMEIGAHIANLIEDGSTIQMGIGGIPDATLLGLKNHRRLGIHTEMFSDGIMGLIESGVVTNTEKQIFPGQIGASFLMGTQKLYDFVDDNPILQMAPSSFINDPHIIRQNPKVVAINSAIEVDLTGQVCADSIGRKIFSGIGGQLDFERGAALSPGGKPIIALPSVTSKGESRIVTTLRQGAGVVTTRGNVHYVVTEYGSTNLFGKSLRQRAESLISIAHPNHRDQLWHDFAGIQMGSTVVPESKTKNKIVEKAAASGNGSAQSSKSTAAK